MLGVRREGLTTAARNLQAAGLISYVRGHIKVLNRPGLETRTCGCYEVVKNEYNRLLPTGYSISYWFFSTIKNRRSQKNLNRSKC